MPLRGSGSASAAVRPYFLDGTRPLSVGTPGAPSLFWIQPPFAVLCEGLHTRGSPIRYAP
jgi:hypothetical protein